MGIYGSFLSNNIIEAVNSSIVNEIDNILNRYGSIPVISESDALGTDPFDSFMLESSLEIEYITENFWDGVKSTASKIKQFFIDLGKRIVGGFKSLLEKIKGIFTKSKNKKNTGSNDAHGLFPITLSDDIAEKIYLYSTDAVNKLSSMVQETGVETKKVLAEIEAVKTLKGGYDSIDDIDDRANAFDKLYRRKVSMIGWSNDIIKKIAQYDITFKDANKNKIDQKDFDMANQISGGSEVSKLVNTCNKGMNDVTSAVSVVTKKVNELEKQMETKKEALNANYFRELSSILIKVGQTMTQVYCLLLSALRHQIIGATSVCTYVSNKKATHITFTN